MSKRKTIRYKKATVKRLVELLKRIDFKVTRHSPDGSHLLIRLPNGESTKYWIIYEQVEHKLEDHRGGCVFMLRDCDILLDDGETVNLVPKDRKNPGIWLSFHNFDGHSKEKVGK